MTKKQERISIREYSRRLGVSDTTVHKAINAGKIVNGVIRVKGKPKIIVDIADKEWGSAIDPMYERDSNKKLHNKLGQQSENTESTIPSVVRLKAAMGAVKLKQEQIALAVMEKKYVDREQVYMALFNLGNEVKQAMLGIPDRAIDEILNAGGRNESHTVLVKYITEALGQLSEINSVKID